MARTHSAAIYRNPSRLAKLRIHKLMGVSIGLTNCLEARRLLINVVQVCFDGCFGEM